MWVGGSTLQGPPKHSPKAFRAKASGPVLRRDPSAIPHFAVSASTTMSTSGTGGGGGLMPAVCGLRCAIKSVVVKDWDVFVAAYLGEFALTPRTFPLRQGVSDDPLSPDIPLHSSIISSFPVHGVAGRPFEVLVHVFSAKLLLVARDHFSPLPFIEYLGLSLTLWFVAVPKRYSLALSTSNRCGCSCACARVRFQCVAVASESMWDVLQNLRLGATRRTWLGSRAVV